MNNDGNNSVAGRVLSSILTSSHRTLDHRRNNFQVRRIERECQVHLAARRHDVRRETLVVFNVAGSEIRGAALELIEQLAGVFSEDIDQYVKSPTVRHANADFFSRA